MSTWERRNLPKVGDRVELVALNDPYTTLPVGTKGTVRFIDDRATIHVEWDGTIIDGLHVPGARLGLCFDAGDRFKLIDDSCTAKLHHGLGHQSTAKCDVVGPHVVHHCRFGANRVAYWRDGQYIAKLKEAGIEIPKSVNEGTMMTGYFDEPPEEEDE